jgi:adenylate cyclase
VKEGEYAVEVPVDEGSELGVLQMGFNQMVHGLRERERMREIFGRHVGAEVAARALSEDLGISGERRQATAMFVDVIASTELTQREDPDEVVAKLNALLDAVVHCISAEGGLINKFLGDGALCIFGAPTEQHDHAARALRAARCLSGQLEHIDGLRAAIGVSSGEVVAGNVGTADRYEYTVIGDAVNEASRLTEQAKLNGSNVLVSSATIDGAGAEASRWCEYDSFLLRGRSEPTLAFAPISV